MDEHLPPLQKAQGWGSPLFRSFGDKVSQPAQGLVPSAAEAASFLRSGGTAEAVPFHGDCRPRGELLFCVDHFRHPPCRKMRDEGGAPTDDCIYEHKTRALSGVSSLGTAEPGRGNLASSSLVRPRTPRALLQEVDAKQVGLDRVPRTDEVARGQGRRYIDLIDQMRAGNPREVRFATEALGKVGRRGPGFDGDHWPSLVSRRETAAEKRTHISRPDSMRAGVPTCVRCRSRRCSCHIPWRVHHP